MIKRVNIIDRSQKCVLDTGLLKEQEFSVLILDIHCLQLVELSKPMPQNANQRTKRKHISCGYGYREGHYFKICIECFRVLWCGDRGPELAGASEQERKVPHGLMV